MTSYFRKKDTSTNYKLMTFNKSGVALLVVRIVTSLQAVRPGTQVRLPAWIRVHSNGEDYRALAYFPNRNSKHTEFVDTTVSNVFSRFNLQQK